MTLSAEVISYQTGKAGDYAFRAYVRVGDKEDDDYAILAGSFGRTEEDARVMAMTKLRQVLSAAQKLTGRNNKE